MESMESESDVARLAALAREKRLPALPDQIIDQSVPVIGVLLGSHDLFDL